MTVLPIPARGPWAADLRGDGRAVRVSAHAEQGLLTVSLWRSDECVGSAHLRPDAVADLVAALTRGLTQLAVRSQDAPAGAALDEADDCGPPPTLTTPA